VSFGAKFNIQTDAIYRVFTEHKQFGGAFMSVRAATWGYIVSGPAVFCVLMFLCSTMDTCCRSSLSFVTIFVHLFVLASRERHIGTVSTRLDVTVALACRSRRRVY